MRMRKLLINVITYLLVVLNYSLFNVKAYSIILELLRGKGGKDLLVQVEKA